MVLRVSLLGELSITGDLAGPARARSARAVALVAFLVMHPAVNGPSGAAKVST